MNANEILSELKTLKAAIDDAEVRIQSSPDNVQYVSNQKDRQHEWSIRIYSLAQRLSLIQNPIPITGVIQINNTNVEFTEEFFDCVNLGYEEAKDDHAKSCNDRKCIQEDHDPFNTYWEEDSNDTRLIGDWVKVDGLWTPDKEKPYAAIVRENVIQVVWSATTVRVNRTCSPCYPGQADLDSGEDPNGILAYTLPKELTEDL